jgi:hypothetical protein
MLFLAAWICASFPISVLIGYLIANGNRDQECCNRHD